MPISKVQDNQKHSHRKRKVILITSIVLVVLFFIVDLTITGYLKYSYTYFKCGQRVPVSVTPSFFYTEDSGYSVPGAASYTITAQNRYYCTRDQAEADGKRPNPLSTEGLQRIEELKREGKL